MKTLIAFASNTGTTEQCAKELAKLLNSEVELIDLRKKKLHSLSGFDNLIVGSYIHASKMNKHAVNLLKTAVGESHIRKIGVFLCMISPEEEFSKYLKLNLGEKIVNSISVKSCFGGVLDPNKVNIFFRPIARKIVQKVTKELGKREIKKENIIKFADEFND